VVEAAEVADDGRQRRRDDRLVERREQQDEESAPKMSRTRWCDSVMALVPVLGGRPSSSPGIAYR
jgi:hypothetical protein